MVERKKLKRKKLKKRPVAERDEYLEGILNKTKQRDRPASCLVQATRHRVTDLIERPPALYGKLDWIIRFGYEFKAFCPTAGGLSVTVSWLKGGRYFRKSHTGDDLQDCIEIIWDAVITDLKEQTNGMA